MSRTSSSSPDQARSDDELVKLPMTSGSLDGCTTGVAGSRLPPPILFAPFRYTIILPIPFSLYQMTSILFHWFAVLKPDVALVLAQTFFSPFP